MLELKVIHENSKSIEFEVKDLDVSVLYILQKILYEDKRVAMAAFKQSHPVLKNITFWLEVNEGNPREILVEACKKAVFLINNFKGEIVKALG